MAAFQGSLPQIEDSDALCIRIKEQDGQNSNSPIKLPSLQEFDQGVQALADTKTPLSNSSPQSLPSFKTVFNPQLPTLQPYAPQELSPAQSYYSAPSPGYQTTSGNWTSPSFVSVNHTPRTAFTTPYPGFTTPDLPPEELYPHAQPKVNNKHCNKKYTVEEGDFVIYLWHDKKLKWEQVRDEFARVFGSEPMRTTQGLQAWYYRMNGVIPCWNKDGYLIFDSDDILEPRTRTIKVRDKDKSEVSSEPLGLAQRYPERGMAYPWVEHKDKIAMSDWGKYFPSCCSLWCSETDVCQPQSASSNSTNEENADDRRRSDGRRISRR